MAAVANSNSNLCIADLYPVVLDLTGVEYDGANREAELLCGNFRLRELAVAVSQPLNAYSNIAPPEALNLSPQKKHHRRGSSFLRLLRASHDESVSATASSTTAGTSSIAASGSAEAANKFIDKYVLVKEIFTSENYELWECINSQSGLRRCVKLIKCTSPVVEIAGRQEAVYLKLAQNCKHIVKLDEVIEEDDKIYIVMEYCSGPSLVVHVQKYDMCNEIDTKIMMYSLLLGLHHLHSLNISHNAVDPNHLVLDSAGDLKITEFTSASRFDSVASNVSSSPFVSPELTLGLPCSPASDMWSFGILMYFCLFGRTPTITKSKKTLRNKIIIPKTEWRMVSRSAKQLILSCLHIEPKLRLTVKQALGHSWFTGKNQYEPRRLRISRRSHSESSASKLLLVRAASTESSSSSASGDTFMTTPSSP